MLLRHPPEHLLPMPAPNFRDFSMSFASVKSKSALVPPCSFIRVRLPYPGSWKRYCDSSIKLKLWSELREMGLRLFSPRRLPSTDMSSLLFLLRLVSAKIYFESLKALLWDWILGKDRCRATGVPAGPYFPFGSRISCSIYEYVGRWLACWRARRI